MRVSFDRWKITVESFIYSTFSELEKVLAWAEDQESIVTMDRARAAFGTGTAEPVDDFEEKSSQVYAVLRNLLEGEPFIALDLASEFPVAVQLVTKTGRD